LAIIDHGKIVATGTPSELKDRLGGDIATIKTSPGAPDVTGVLTALNGVTSVQKQDGTYRVKCTNGESFVPKAVEACDRAGAGVTGVTVKRPSLDEVFLEFTGREFREEEGMDATARAVMVQRVQNRFGGRR
jgi:ABC-2 type transport system ATP-binding protein